MTDWTRRNVLKSGLAAAGASLVTPAIARALDAAGSSLPGDGEAPVAPALPLADSPRERLLLDFGWRFLLGRGADLGPEYGWNNGNGFNKAGNLFPASNPKFDASAWREVNLPHDWAIELPFVNDKQLGSWGFKPVGRGYPDTSFGWYRRTFTLPASDSGRRISLEFDGVFRDCTVALNGHLLGRNLSGYAPFRFDVTDVAEYGGENILVVRVDATEHEGWFYEGAGIYRHVWLTKTSPVHVPQWGTYVTSEVAAGAATLTIATEVANEAEVPASAVVVSTVVDGVGKTVASGRSSALRVDPWSTGETRQTMKVTAPALWSPDLPHLYTLVTTVETNGAVVDRYETPFGIRTLEFDAEQGFFLNGERVEIKGTCNHQDHAGVGAALPDRLQYYRIERLKEMGSNAYRTSHNPPTPELLDACDRLGMMVLDETRMFGSSEEALGQLERLVRRDRNRACVIAWSILNEEPTQGAPRGAMIARPMVRLVRRLDPTREITAAMDSGWGAGAATVVDIQGFNYRAPQTDAFHQAHPTVPVWGTEMGSTVSTRGIYANDEARGYVSAYDVNAPWWASTAEAWWSHFATRRWLLGAFVWTGFDYRGEPTPYGWPCISSHFGILDTCGFPKDNFYYYRAWWSDKPVLHLFPHWNWAGREGQEVEVWCHTNLERVELFLNGKSLGTRLVPRNSHAMWKVPYAPGRIEVRGYRGGKQVLVDARETTGPAAGVVLRADRSRIAADGEDVSVIMARVVDAKGHVVPTAADEITFRVASGGRLLGVGNGDPSSHESDRGPSRHAFAGLCSAIVQSSKSAGTMRVEASAPGLAPATVEITCTEATPRPTA